MKILINKNFNKEIDISNIKNIKEVYPEIMDELQRILSKKNLIYIGYFNYWISNSGISYFPDPRFKSLIEWEDEYAPIKRGFKSVDYPHMTVKFRPGAEDLLKILSLPADITAKLMQYGYDAENEGLLIRPYDVNLKQFGVYCPHITLGVGPNGKAVNTPKIEKWGEVPFDARGQYHLPHKTTMRLGAYTPTGVIFMEDILDELTPILLQYGDKIIMDGGHTLAFEVAKLQEEAEAEAYVIQKAKEEAEKKAREKYLQQVKAEDEHFHKEAEKIKEILKEGGILIKQQYGAPLLLSKKDCEKETKHGFNFDEISFWHWGGKEINPDLIPENIRKISLDRDNPYIKKLNLEGISSYKNQINFEDGIPHYFKIYMMEEDTDYDDMYCRGASIIVKEEDLPKVRLTKYTVDTWMGEETRYGFTTEGKVEEAKLEGEYYLHVVEYDHHREEEISEMDNYVQKFFKEIYPIPFEEEILPEEEEEKEEELPQKFDWAVEYTVQTKKGEEYRKCVLLSKTQEEVEEILQSKKRWKEYSYFDLSEDGKKYALEHKIAYSEDGENWEFSHCL